MTARDPPLPPPYASGRDGLTIEGRSVEELAQEFGTPLYLMSESRIRANARRFLSAFQAVWPRYRLLFALKANPNPAIVRILREEGLGADCSSPAEIRIAREAGVPPSETLYTAAYPSESELAAAIAGEVSINLDDPDLLPGLLRIGTPPRLSFRINPGRTSSGPEGLKFAGRAAKFGVPIGRAIEGYRAARRAGIERFGLHTMPGSNVLDPAHFNWVGRFLGESVRRVERNAGIELEFLDGGGGFGVPYRPGERALDLERVARGLAGSLRTALGAGASDPRWELCHEPGRFLLADSTVLVTRMTHVKSTRPPFVGVDAGMHTLLRPALYQAYHPVHLVRPPKAAPRTITLVGPVCENTDVLAARRRLPMPRPGELYALGNAGAYGFSMSSQYNTRPRPAELLVRPNGRALLIREAESFDDIVRHVRPLEAPAGASPP